MMWTESVAGDLGSPSRCCQNTSGPYSWRAGVGREVGGGWKCIYIFRYIYIYIYIYIFFYISALTGRRRMLKPVYKAGLKARRDH